MKPWTWEQLGREGDLSSFVDPFVQQYGKIGAVALEMAHRLAHPEQAKRSLAVQFSNSVRDCSCARCKQWHHDWSDDRLMKHYAKLYALGVQYGCANMVP